MSASLMFLPCDWMKMAPPVTKFCHANKKVSFWWPKNSASVLYYCLSEFILYHHGLLNDVWWFVFVGFQLDTDEGASFLPGFVDAVIGIENGETKNFDLTFPQTWEQESLRGLQARFTVSTKTPSFSFLLNRHCVFSLFLITFPWKLLCMLNLEACYVL